MTDRLAIAAREIQEASRAYVAEYPNRPPQPIEGGIWRPCVALRAHGINTTGSCEGHVQYPASLPYITFAPFTKSNGDIDPVEWDEQIETVVHRLNTLYLLRAPIRAPIRLNRRGKMGYRGRSGLKLPQVVTLTCHKPPTFFRRWSELGRHLLLPEYVKQTRIEKDRAEFDFFAAFLEKLLAGSYPTLPPTTAT